MGLGAPSVTSFEWNVPGGDPFLDYQANANSATFTPFTPPTGSTAQFYFRTGASNIPVGCTVKFQDVPGKASLEVAVSSISPTFHNRYESPNLGHPELLKDTQPRVPTSLVSEVEVFGMYGAERQGFTEFKLGIA